MRVTAVADCFRRSTSLGIQEITMPIFAGSIRHVRRCGALVATIVCGAMISSASAQQHDHTHHGTTTTTTPAPAPAPADHATHQTTKGAKPALTKTVRAKPKAHQGHAAHATPQHGTPGAAPAEHGAHQQHGGMKAFLGPYAMTREGSGTSWVPDVTPHEGIHGKFGDWTT